MKALYKYPQAAFPVRRSSSRRTGAAAGNEPEFELTDTGVFDGDRYFDVAIEYAKASANDILIRIEVANRGPEAARAARAADAVVPQHVVVGTDRRRLLAQAAAARELPARVRAEHATLGTFELHGDATGTAAPTLLFTDNETNYAAPLRRRESRRPT